MSNSGLQVVIPPPRNAKISGDPCESKHDEYVTFINEYGRKAWEKKYNYGKRERVEAHFSRLKRCIGPNLKTRKIESQKNEGIISGKILNYWNELGRCKTVRVA